MNLHKLFSGKKLLDLPLTDRVLLLYAQLATRKHELEEELKKAFPIGRLNAVYSEGKLKKFGYVKGPRSRLRR